MGIRITLCAGYGLDITNLPKEGLAFDKLEDEKAFKAYLRDVRNNIDRDLNFQDHMMIDMATLPTKYGIKKKEPITDFVDMVGYNPEFAFKDKLLLYPIGYKERWHRYGDILDSFVFEASQAPGEFDMLCMWQEKPGTLYPIHGLMRANPEMPFGIEEYDVPRYLDKLEHRDAIPRAPIHLWFLIKHLGLATEPEEITRIFLSLRPTVMRYWS